MQDLIRQLRAYAKIIISCDLDNTLVDRARGANYVSPELQNALINIQKAKHITLLPNTGRDQWAFEAFCNENMRITNAVLGNGSLILFRNNLTFNPSSAINKDCIHLFSLAVQNEILPFFDMSSSGERIIARNGGNTFKSGLILAQNPPEWKPYIRYAVKKINEIEPNEKDVFRIEFPISKKHSALYKFIEKKSPDALAELVQLLGMPTHTLNEYSLYKKAFFKEEYKKEYVFARLQKNEIFSNKGIGLKMWTEFEGVDLTNSCVLHLGDKVDGMVNDALVQRNFEHSFTIIVNPKIYMEPSAQGLTYIQGDPQLVLPKLLRALI